MRWTTVAVVALILCAAGLEAQLRLPADFSRRLNQRGMMLDLAPLSGYTLVPVISNDDMEYDLALQSPTGRLEVRYALRDWPGSSGSADNLAFATLLNVGPSVADRSRLGPFPTEAVRREFGAEQGYSSAPFEPRDTFSAAYDTGMMSVIWLEGRAMAYMFYLFNEAEREAALDEWRAVFYALQFRR